MTRIRIPLSAFFLLVFATIVLTTPRLAWALPCHDKLYIFYSDPSYQNQVGYWGMDCSGRQHQQGGSWGSDPYPYLTEYFIESEECCDNPSCQGTEYECTGSTTTCTGDQPCPYPTRPW